MKILLDHPETKDRIAAINAVAVAGATSAASRRRGLERAQANLRAAAGQGCQRRRNGVSRATKAEREDDATPQLHRTADFAARRLGAPHRAVFAGRDADRGHHRALGRARYRAGAVDAGRRAGARRASRSCSPSAPASSSGGEGVGGGRQAVTALFIGFALIAYPLYLGIKAYRLPAIYDITTDPIDPPQFDAIARLRPRDANPITYAGLYTAEQQHAAYSDIEPDDTNSTPQEAYDAAMKVIAKRRWRVVDARPPQAAAAARRSMRARRRARRARDGIIEAVARTPILGFRDDVVVRVRADHRRRPHRRALGLALRPPRSRHQCRARAQSDRRHRRRAVGCRRRRRKRRRQNPLSRRPRARRPSDRCRRSTAVRRSRRRRARPGLRDAPAPTERPRRRGADRARYRSP